MLIDVVNASNSMVEFPTLNGGISYAPASSRGGGALLFVCITCLALYMLPKLLIVDLFISLQWCDGFHALLN